jgi:MFS family permease
MISNRQFGIIACILTATTVTITLGLTWPFLSIVLEKQGLSAWLIGISASGQMLAVLLIAPLGPRIIGWLGTAKTLAAGMVGMACALALLPVFPTIWAWFPIRCFLGFCAELTFAVGDIWINQLAREETRGRLVAVYSMFLSAGLALGPVAIVFLGTDSWHVIYLGIAVIVLGLVPLYIARNAAPLVEGKPRARLLHFLRQAPTLMLAGLMFGLIDSATFSMLPVFGLAHGLSQETAAMLLTMFVIGSVVGQLPLGWLADHLDRRKLLAWCVFASLWALVALPFSLDSLVATWTVMMVIGLTQGSFYLLAMVMMGSRFKGAELIGVNASFVFLWGLGMVIGPSITGIAMDLIGPNGLPVVAALFCTIFLVIIVRRIMTQPPEKPGQTQGGAVL